MNTLNDTRSGSHKIIRKFLHLFSAHQLRELLQTAFLIYLARYSTETYGQFMLAFSIGQILQFIAEMGLNQHLTKLLAGKHDYPSAVIMQITCIKGALLTLAWLGMIGFIFWQGYEPSLKLLIIVIASGIMLEALATSFFVALQVRGRQDVEARIRGTGAVLGFGYGLSGLALAVTPLALAFFKLIETLFNLAAGVRIFLQRPKFSISFSQLAPMWQMWRGGIIFTLISTCAIFFNKINMFFLKSHGGDVGVAQYSVTWQVVDGFSIMVSSLLLGRIMYAIFVRLYTTDKDSFVQLARVTARWLLALATPLMFVLFVESDRIITIIFGDSYGDAIWMQKILVFTIVIAFLHNLAQYLMFTMGRQRMVLVIYILGLAFNLAACMYLIPGDVLRGTCLAILYTKLAIGLCTVSYCQIKLRLFPLATILQYGAALALGALLYCGGSTYILRELGEILAIVPMAWLIWKWKKEFDRLRESQQRS